MVFTNTQCRQLYGGIRSEIGFKRRLIIIIFVFRSFYARRYGHRSLLDISRDNAYNCTILTYTPARELNFVRLIYRRFIYHGINTRVLYRLPIWLKRSRTKRIYVRALGYRRNDQFDFN